jgi:hypothetical protein
VLQILGGTWVDDAALIKQKLKGKEAIAAASVVSEPVSKKIRVAGGGGGGRSTNLAGFTGPIPPPSNHTPDKLVSVQNRSFRGESRWIGFTVVSGDAPGTKSAVGLTDAGQVFVAQDAQLLCSGDCVPTASDDVL